MQQKKESLNTTTEKPKCYFCNEEAVWSGFMPMCPKVEEMEERINSKDWEEYNVDEATYDQFRNTIGRGRLCEEHLKSEYDG